MCEAGRVLHHLRHNAGDPKSTILITGFQAENTLGRRLLSRPDQVRIFGIWTPLRAEVESLDDSPATPTRKNCWPGWRPGRLN